jgi:hypothetical protein
VQGLVPGDTDADSAHHRVIFFLLHERTLRFVEAVLGFARQWSQGNVMKKLAVMTLCVFVLASTAYAGGPVVVVEDLPPVVEERSASSKGLVPLLLVPLLLCVFVCGDDDEDPAPRS